MGDGDGKKRSETKWGNEKIYNGKVRVVRKIKSARRGGEPQERRRIRDQR